MRHLVQRNQVLLSTLLMLFHMRLGLGGKDLSFGQWGAKP